MPIDIHSSTWTAIRRKLEEAKAEAVENLIADAQSEKQRGRIALIEELIEFSKTPEKKEYVSVDTYDN